MTVDAAADHVERNYGAATEYERALQELVEDLRKRVYSLEQQQPTPVAAAEQFHDKPDELLNSWGLLAPGRFGNTEHRAIYSALARIVNEQDVEETSASDLLQFAITVLDRMSHSVLLMRETLIKLGR
jgi:hypothetical protein